MTSRKRPLDDSEAKSSSSRSAGVLPDRDRELLMIERDLLARIVLKQHCAYKRIDIIDRLKQVVKAVDTLLTGALVNSQQTVKLRIATERASERFFQQMSMGLMIPMSVACLGALGRIRKLLERLYFNKTDDIITADTICTAASCSDDEGVRIER